MYDAALWSWLGMSMFMTDVVISVYVELYEAIISSVYLFITSVHAGYFISDHNIVLKYYIYQIMQVGVKCVDSLGISLRGFGRFKSA